MSSWDLGSKCGNEGWTFLNNGADSNLFLKDLLLVRNVGLQVADAKANVVRPTCLISQDPLVFTLHTKGKGCLHVLIQHYYVSSYRAIDPLSRCFSVIHKTRLANMRETKCFFPDETVFKQDKSWAFKCMRNK